MPKQNKPEDQPARNPNAQRQDAVRHVGKTLESEGVYVPSDELPENRIEMEGMTETVDMNAVTADPYDREANAMGAERLRTRLPGDTSSDPHTDEGADNATTLDDDRPHRRNNAA
ncbi:MAG TPA: hypothetical protein VKT75_12665 [Acidobacteriaceae bacterium]|nr:hypothetical protein [Acidobacteriaceae bacterium]